MDPAGEDQVDDTRPRIVVDGMGGEHAPEAVLEGADRVLASDPALRISLTGPEGVVTPFAATRDRVQALPASERIDMGEHPVRAVRSKRDSSLAVAARVVGEGRADGWFTAGSTGAAMAASTLLIGRIDAVERPALAVVVPTPSHPVVFLDVGANADCRAEHLLGFARMGSAYSRLVLGVDTPRVGLLNIGEEASKGSALAQEAHELLGSALDGFVGNVEGHDLPRGAVDVVVTDGFTGNVALKLMEGLTSTLFTGLKRAMTSSMARSAAALALRPALREIADELDPDAYGGAPLLGVEGVAIVGHGSSGAQAVHHGIAAAARAVRRGLVDEIRSAMAAGTEVENV